MNTSPVLCPAPHPAAAVLLQSPLPDLRRLDVSETDEEVIITGSVPSYYLKQLAQEALRPVLGTRRLRNRVTVRKP